MATKQEILDYIDNTPYNSNRAVLDTMLEDGGEEKEEPIHLEIRVNSGTTGLNILVPFTNKDETRAFVGQAENTTTLNKGYIPASWTHIKVSHDQLPSGKTLYGTIDDTHYSEVDSNGWMDLRPLLDSEAETIIITFILEESQ